jgi:succinate-semialdehyde dehydrogenase/glutarate-semialdehyde dehydrogenase
MTDAYLESVNPATEEVVGRHRVHTEAEVSAALRSAHDAFLRWRHEPLPERARLLRALAAGLRERKDEFARLITTEMGKPIVEARAEVERCAVNCEYYAENGPRFLADEAVDTSASQSVVRFQPLGCVLAVMPWNLPFWQVFRCTAPALMAGNAVVLKHASNVSQCALAIENLIRDVGVPAGLFVVVLMRGREAERLVEHDLVRAVTVTGSDATGARIASLAGAHIKKTVLELGGSDPFVVLPDADLDAAAAAGARSRNINAGQSCIAAKRFIVHDSVADAFEARLVASVEALILGDPLNEATSVGPLARPDIRAALEDQVARSVAAGARVLVGGGRPDGPGYYYLPTVLADVRLDMPVFREETFGPVAAVVRVADQDEAIALANDTRYGLGAAVWSRDLDRAWEVAGRLEAGTIVINGIVASDPRMPFGGVKASGYGRELSSFGLREFVNVQSVWVT